MKNNKLVSLITVIATMLVLSACKTQDWQWELIETTGQPTARHEASFVEHHGKLYLIGGRRINPTDVFDPKTNSWSQKKPTPIELHHFQAVSIGDAIYIVGAMTGAYPNETPLKNVIVYYPATDEYQFTHDIPAARQRGAAAAVTYNGKIYLAGGITNGHVDGSRSWLDEYDPKTGEWQVLPDAKFARDHVQATVLGDQLYVFGGRTSRQRTDEVLSLLVEHGEVFDFSTGEWQAATESLALPTRRAGNMIASWGDEIIIGGGESHTQEAAHSELDAYNVTNGSWRRWPDSQRGRHGSGFAINDGYVYTASGSGNRGGGPELTTIERLKLPKPNAVSSNPISQGLPVHQQWHTISIPFHGPQSAETAADNPFTNYRLDVEFSNLTDSKTVRGFYAADGNAAQTGAEDGNVWMVRFSPPNVGKWSYKATLRKGIDIATSDDLTSAEMITLENNSGEFIVVKTDKDQSDFRANGLLGVDGAYFRFTDSGQYWIKAGANSPENLLGYFEFDGTYRVGAQARDGEAAAGEILHTFAPHSKDWTLSDPTWRGDKGKNIIGGINYLAEKGMNAVYFLSMNINGDGNDVWPFTSHTEFARFDVSKLEQWEILFEHMQSKGLLLHLVTQETENERLFDDGDVGPQRRLYYNELIARFAHHPGLVWNLGEENGPAEWSPIAQNDEQRKAMAAYLKDADPYKHPVLLHTHSTPEDKDRLLPPLLGDTSLDGLSFQVHLREQAHDEVIRWREKSRKAGKEWLITMDEIGEWHTAALPDELDPNHDTLRRYALWGTLMAGAAGVEWYFGAKYPANDLTSEDWRLRDRLWTITNHARGFFQDHVPFWNMSSNDALASAKGAYVLAKPGDVYLVYIPTSEAPTLIMDGQVAKYNVEWFDPLLGGDLQLGSVQTIDAKNTINSTASSVNLGLPPKADKQDWVVLVRRVVTE